MHKKGMKFGKSAPATDERILMLLDQDESADVAAILGIDEEEVEAAIKRAGRKVKKNWIYLNEKTGQWGRARTWRKAYWNICLKGWAYWNIYKAA